MPRSYSKKYMVIDLFAGPGGLGEGFSAFRDAQGDAPFNIAMSVEFEKMAHRTLLLRSFFRQFSDGAPDGYYEYIRGKITRDSLFEQWPEQARKAAEEVLEKPRKLGPSDTENTAGDEEFIHARLCELVRQHKGPIVVIGGPPCQAYSTVGRARNKGKQGYKVADDERYFLYEEYSKVLATCKPDVFILENVVGMLSAKLNKRPIVCDVLESLRKPRLRGRVRNEKGCQYRIYSVVTGGEITELPRQGQDCVVRMQNYGVPQARKRVILLGVLERDGSERRPSPLAPTSGEKQQVPTVRQVIHELPRLRSQLSHGNDSTAEWHKTIKASGELVARELKKNKLDATKVKAAVENALRLKHVGGRFVHSTIKYKGPAHLYAWLFDPRMGGFANHESRGHMASDLSRYLYYASYAAQSDGVSPHVYDLPESLKPNHRNVKNSNGDTKTRKFSDRFKVLPKNRPAFTITSHIKKDGHYYIHYDPSQIRSLTVREAARLQTFPDNYFFEGTQGAQYQQVGNAVPPWLAHQIAEIVHQLLS